MQIDDLLSSIVGKWVHKQDGATQMFWLIVPAFVMRLGWGS